MSDIDWHQVANDLTNCLAQRNADLTAARAELKEAVQMLRDIRPWIPNAPYALPERLDAFLAFLDRIGKQSKVGP